MRMDDVRLPRSPFTFSFSRALRIHRRQETQGDSNSTRKEMQRGFYSTLRSTSHAACLSHSTELYVIFSASVSNCMRRCFFFWALLRPNHCSTGSHRYYGRWIQMLQSNWNGKRSIRYVFLRVSRLISLAHICWFIWTDLNRNDKRSTNMRWRFFSSYTDNRLDDIYL